jgi:hypothetical protein
LENRWKTQNEAPQRHLNRVTIGPGKEFLEHSKAVQADLVHIYGARALSRSLPVVALCALTGELVACPMQRYILAYSQGPLLMRLHHRRTERMSSYEFGGFVSFTLAIILQ